MYLDKQNDEQTIWMQRKKEEEEGKTMSFDILIEHVFVGC